MNGQAIKRICVFCGSSLGAREVYAAAARAMACEMVRRGIGLVYGGGNVGLMGVIADAVMDAGGEAIGVIPEHLMARELGHSRLTELVVVGTMHERKARMADLAEGFVALPGGFGTWDEFCEVVTWAQLGLHSKPCAMLNTEGYYDPMLAMFDMATEEGFVRPPYRGMLIVSADPGELLEGMARYEGPAVAKWMEREDR